MSPRSSTLFGFLVVLALCGAMAGKAQARIFFGFGAPLFYPPVIGAPPLYYGPGYYGPPPMVYAPPGNTFSYTPPSFTPQPGTAQRGGWYQPSDGYAPPPGALADDDSQSCHAGPYLCPLLEDTPPGGACACPGHDGRLIRGQAD